MTGYGKLAYEGYSAASGGRSLATGDELPPWPELQPDIQGAWDAAAGAVISGNPDEDILDAESLRIIELLTARITERLSASVISSVFPAFIGEQIREAHQAGGRVMSHVIPLKGPVALFAHYRFNPDGTINMEFRDTAGRPFWEGTFRPAALKTSVLNYKRVPGLFPGPSFLADIGRRRNLPRANLHRREPRKIYLSANPAGVVAYRDVRSLHSAVTWPVVRSGACSRTACGQSRTGAL